jgi:hypothetical protein
MFRRVTVRVEPEAGSGSIESEQSLKDQINRFKGFIR